ncbi:hypothetical protein FBZ93_12290 [Bradyrhizobium macuxiense]|uniref:Uncharacterized protein n=1 Tax=Bradyrhizobium macuxiense TaxID=1755647 RepID=A0A560KW28_9BRAD|nr:hypothetical protein FBZ93_12290 [Bradyrhizobium macuxiense]
MDVRHDPSNLFLLGAIGFRIKNSPVRHQKLLIMGSEH